MPVPGSGGGIATRQQQIAYYAESLNSAFPRSETGIDLGADYKKYMSQHPKADPVQVYNQTVAGLDVFLQSGRSLADAIASAVGTQGNITSQFVKGVGKGAEDITKSASGFGLGGSDWQHLLIRLAEFGIGGILIAVGIAAILGKTKTGQTVINVAEDVIPAGRAAKVARPARRDISAAGRSRPGFTKGGLND